jgi:hypothetical protein
MSSVSSAPLKLAARKIGRPPFVLFETASEIIDQKPDKYNLKIYFNLMP